MARIIGVSGATCATLITSMGCDADIINAASRSTGKDIKDDSALLNYLITNRHSTPFEMCTFSFEIMAPVGIMTQVLRHRCFGAVQASTRYGNVGFECLTTGSDKLDALVLEIMNLIEDTKIGGRTRECLHMALPRGLITNATVACNLRGLANFFRLRLEKHAQEEIRNLAEEMLAEIKWEGKLPMTVEKLEKAKWVL